MPYHRRVCSSTGRSPTSDRSRRRGHGKKKEATHEQVRAYVPGHDPRARAVLGRSRLHRDAALRLRGRGRHLPHRHHAAQPRPQRLAYLLPAALPPPRGRPLRREPQPNAALLPVPGHPEALPGGLPGPLLGLAQGHRARPRRARRPLCRGRLGEPDARRLGPRLGGLDGRHGGHAVHVLPAGRRHRGRPRSRGDHLRPRAHRDVRAGRRLRLRPHLVLSARRHAHDLRRRLPRERGGVLDLQLRGRRCRDDAPQVR